jgi:hypothetical protein
LDQIHNPKTVASVLKKLIKERKVETMVVSSIAKELLQEIDVKCPPSEVRSLLIGIRSFRLLGGLIRLFSEVLMLSFSWHTNRHTNKQLVSRQTNSDCK